MNMVAAVTFPVATAPVLWTVAVTIGFSPLIAAAPITVIEPGGAASGGSYVLMRAPEILLVRDLSDISSRPEYGCDAK